MRAPRRITAALAAGTAACLTALTAPAASAATWTSVYNGNASSAPLAVRVLTPDGADTSVIAKAGGTVTMTAPVTNNAASNLRKVFWPAGLAARASEQSCATWASQSDDREQEGIALRITSANGDVRAITVTKNVIYGIWWDFNVHTWDSQAAQPFTQIAQFDYGNVVAASDGTEAPFPWRACARVQGATLTFKVWVPAQEPEPSWADPAFARTATIPAGYLNAGQAGWYAGHIPAGGTAAYTQLGLWAGS
jgi:hypothetical protein